MNWLLSILSLITISFTSEWGREDLLPQSEDQKALREEYELFNPTPIMPASEGYGPGGHSQDLMVGLTGWWDINNPRCYWDYVNGKFYNLISRWSYMSYSDADVDGTRLAKFLHPGNLYGRYSALILGSTYTATIPTSILSTSAGTFLAWVRTNSNPTSHALEYLLDHQNSGNQINLYRTANSGVWKCVLGDGLTVSEGITSQAQFSWALVGITWDGTNQTVVYNGAIEDTDTYANLSSLGTNAYIGSSSTSSNQLNGRLIGPFIWNRALSAVELADFYNRLQGLCQTDPPWPDICSYEPSIVSGSVVVDPLAVGARGMIVPSNGNYLFKTDSNLTNTLSSWDISNPASPSKLDGEGSSSLYQCGYIQIIGNYLYGYSYNYDVFSIWDISDPSNLSLAGSISDGTTMNGTIAFDIDGNYAYVCAYLANRLNVIDISVPGSMSIVGFYSDATNLPNPRYVKKIGNYCVVVGATGVVTSIDVSVPSSPSYITKFSDSTNLSGTGWGEQIGNYLIVPSTDSKSLSTINISDPSSPSLTDTVKGTGWGILNGINSVKVNSAQTTAYASTGAAILVFDISDPTDLKLRNHYYDGNNSNSYCLALNPNNEKHLWSDSQYTDCLYALNVNIVHRNMYVGSVQDDTYLANIYRVKVAGNYAYTLGYSGTTYYFSIIDISTKTNPSIVGYFTSATIQYSTDLAVGSDGNWAYTVVQGSNRFVVIDCQTKNSPHVEGSVVDATNLSGASGVETYGNYGYVACYNGHRVTTIDISTKTSPSVSGSIQDSTNLYFSRGITMIGTTHVAVTSRNNNRVTIVDISNPVSLSVTGSVTSSTLLATPFDITVTSGLQSVYTGSATDAANRLTATDISTLASPVVHDSEQHVRYAGYDLGGGSGQGTSFLCSIGNYIFVSSGDSHTISCANGSDIDNITNLLFYSNTSQIYKPLGIDTDGTYLYVASSLNNTMVILDPTEMMNPPDYVECP